MTTDDIESARRMMDEVRVARLDFCVFRHDSGQPGETAALSRVLWRHAPEMASRMGLEIRKDEGHDPESGVTIPDSVLPSMMARDMAEARPIASWLKAHISPATAALFAHGADNAFDLAIERFAARRGFERTDGIAVEAGRIEAPSQASTRLSLAPAAALSASRSR